MIAFQHVKHPRLSGEACFLLGTSSLAAIIALTKLVACNMKIFQYLHLLVLTPGTAFGETLCHHPCVLKVVSLVGEGATTKATCSQFILRFQVKRYVLMIVGLHSISAGYCISYILCISTLFLDHELIL